MDYSALIPIVVAASTGLGIGLAEGKRYLASRAAKNGKAKSGDSDPSGLMNPRLTKSGHFPNLCEICPDHKIMDEHNKQALHLSQTLQTSVASAAAAASTASAAAMRVEQKVHEDGEQTRSALKEFGQKFETLLEWKGRIETRTDHVEEGIDTLTGQTAALWGAVRKNA